LPDLHHLHHLADRYATTFDHGNATAWASCFEPDGEFVSVTGTPYRGHPHLTTFAADLHHRWANQGLHPRHSWSNFEVLDRTPIPTGTLWHCTSHGLVYLDHDKPSTEPAMRTVYLDTILQSETGTRFASRRATAR
jgi:hypothetical protein